MCNMIIRKFDEDMSLKAAKTTIKEIYQYCHKHFEVKGSLDAELDEKLNIALDQQNDLLKDMKER